MKIVIKTTNIKLDQALEDFIERKINDLEKFAKVFQGEEYFNGYYGKGKPRVEAWVEIGKETLHHKKGPYFYTECQMRFPGRSLRSTANSPDLRLAICEVKDKLQRQLKQYKEKAGAKTKKGQRSPKKIKKEAKEEGR
ncbi:MAG: ribosomal subunit interface protein [Candidatus Nealsonbacteria bacterium CG08_land_8_20_14_0_20_38_20]|uniref:Ribosomal subunit interface protein n=1 Tax=Candidatus Nealsonbacteria bacterium CG08_land_8_20_14_0_20_38_20 TaxID=1974705 RepID=A0A2H0YM91_9BACT|nr:MAG: ribosomal subunit interface protein [Candidatus Nealsonbacteria bacterium CG08_land_8_20_14_0_20_38_20]